MKFLAFLRDSVREAIDAKVFFVLLGLSALAIGTVASLRFEPLSVETEVDKLARLLNWVFPAQTKHGIEGVTIADFQQTNEAAEPWNGDYRFLVVVHFAKEEEAETERNKGMASSIVGQLFSQHLHYLKDVKATVAPSAEPKEVRYLVTTHGSNISTLGDWPHRPYVFFTVPLSFFDSPLPQMVLFIEDWLVNWIGAAVALLISVVVTAFFIPNMMRKGTVDLLLAKPVGRTQLLLYKYVGGLSFMFLNTVVIVVGLWLVLGWRTGVWGTGFLLTIFVLTFQFAVYYAISTVVAVWTRSPIVAILISCLAWALFLVVGVGYRAIDATRVATKAGAEALNPDAKTEELPEDALPLPKWVYTTADIVHVVTPRMKDLDALISKLLTDDLFPPDSRERKQADKTYAKFNWGEALGVSLAYIVGLLGLACWRFSRVDF